MPMDHTDCFLKLDGIDGESTDHDYPKWIVITSMSYGATNNRPAVTGGGGGGAGKVSVHDVTVTSVLNSASPAIFSHVVKGIKIANAEIHCRKGGETPQ